MHFAQTGCTTLTPFPRYFAYYSPNGIFIQSKVTSFCVKHKKLQIVTERHIFAPDGAENLYIVRIYCFKGGKFTLFTAPDAAARIHLLPPFSVQ